MRADNAAILQILNDYLHLLWNHGSEQFEFVVQQFESCDIMKCSIFRRNARDRQDVTPTIDTKRSVYQEIMDKIHCCFLHCFDVGNRLSIEEKNAINESDEKHAETKNDEVQSVSARIIQMNEILLCKRTLCKNVLSHLNNRMCCKYDQLISENNIFINTEKIYSFGISFKYGYDEEPEMKNDVFVKPKYSTLKAELISNIISKINILQFNNEYAKASIHFGSYYCRAMLNSRKRRYNSYDRDLTIECILSIMIYCNYDILQSKFSRTYRENNGNDHDEFYHLAKFLKISVMSFGTQIMDDKIKKFYHGIQEKVLLPNYINSVTVSSPLSTSSQMEVAINFANANKGIVIAFTHVTKHWTVGESPRSFSCAWLSNYANEKEHLFLQQRKPLLIVNILDVKFGH
eukprot:196614_1